MSGSIRRLFFVIFFSVDYSLCKLTTFYCISKKNSYLCIPYPLKGSMNDEYIVPVNGLAQGGTQFRLQAGKAFFGQFGNPEILDADVQVVVTVLKTGRTVEVDCDIEGRVTVPCDRCLGDLELPVSTRALLRVGEAAEEDGSEQDGREIVLADTPDGGLDLAQVIYDYVCTSLPLHKVHPDGGCDPSVQRYLNVSEPEKEISAPAEDNPFSALKNLFKDSGK